MENHSKLVESGSLRQLHILVVEDSADSLQMICDLLNVLGHQTQGVGSGESALEMLAVKKFDVLFTDISLPGMGGVDLARKAVAKTPDIKVIFASGYDNSMARYIGFPSIWLTKPYEFEALTQALAQLY